MNVKHRHVILLLIGFASSPAHAVKPKCGDGVGQASEQCDGADLRGHTCQEFGFASGDLVCTAECQLDTSGCSGLEPTQCGNGIREDFEECDGASDASCPGLCSAHCACPSAQPGSQLEVHVIDVGQADSILVVSPDGFVMLVDSGEESDASAVLAYLNGLGISGIDYTLVSHMHTDHVGGMDVVLGQYTGTVACFDHGGAYTSTEYDEYDLAADSRRQMVSAGGTIDMGSSMTVEVLHAFADSSLENNNSVVIRLTYGSTSFLLGGDCESGCESSFDPGIIDVYKVHHHGSASASTDGFLSRMGADLALISVGEGNPYDHPAQETLDRLTGYGVMTYRTDLDGNLVVTSDGNGYSIGGQAQCGNGESRSCGQTDVGVCEFGIQDCVDGVWGTCVGAVDPIDEICNNLQDDDCDGLDDNMDPDCTNGSGAEDVLIAQVSYDTPGTDEIEEFVDLYNPTADAVALDDWILSDNLGSWTIPAGTTIDPGAYLTIARNAAGFLALYALDPDVSGMSLALGNTGDVLVLSDYNGMEVDRVAWEDFEPGWSITASTGNSIERTDPTQDSDGPADWQVTSPAAPRGGSESSGGCGDGTCSAGEDCVSCPEDCIGRLEGAPKKQFCCGNGTCEPVGEDSSNCPLDCL